METHEPPVTALHGIEAVRARLAPRMRIPAWRPAVPAVALGAAFAAIGLTSHDTLAFYLCFAIIAMDTATQLQRGTRPLAVWQTSARSMAVVYVALIAIAGAASIALVGRDAWAWVNGVIGVVVAVATFAIVAVWHARLARPVPSRAPDIRQFDAALADPLPLRVMAALASYQGHIETVVLEEALETPAIEVGPALAPLIAAGYAEYTRPDGPWGRARIWLRATPAGRAALDGHVAALRAATAGS